MLVRVFLLIALATVTMSAPTAPTPRALLVEPVDIQLEWTNWKTTHNRTYDTPEEESKRFEIFKENVKKITEHNKKYEKEEVTWSQGLNQFSDLTQKEFSEIYLGGNSKRSDGLVGAH